MKLDIETVLFSVGLVGLVLVIFSWTMALAPQTNRSRRSLAWGNTAILAGVTLLLSQGTLDPWVSIILANALVILGYHLLELSLRRFAGKPTPAWAVVSLLLAFTVPFVLFTLVWNLYPARVVVYSLLVIAVWVRVLFVLRDLPEYRRNPGAVRSFMALCVLILGAQAARAVIAVGQNGQSLLTPSDALALMLLISVLVLVAWTAGYGTLELLRVRGRLEESLETRDRMMQLIAHDLRGPIGGQVGLLELMRGEGQCREDDGELLNLAAVSAQRSFDLLENLLDWAQHQKGAIVLKPEPLEVKELLEEAAEPYRTTAHTKALKLSIECGPGTMTADRRTLTTIVRNLLSNAVKFTPNGGTIRIAYSFEPSGAVLRVIDSGPGLTEEQRTRFNAGQPLVSTAGTDNESGSGLGLTLCRDFAQRNGATLTFAPSAPGTTAEVRFPLR